MQPYTANLVPSGKESIQSCFKNSAFYRVNNMVVFFLLDSSLGDFAKNPQHLGETTPCTPPHFVLLTPHMLASALLNFLMI